VSDLEQFIHRKVELKRIELESNAGLRNEPLRHYRRPKECPFTRQQRERTTILFGGFTRTHERLIESAWRGLGYRCEALPTPDRQACRLGMEFGNNGQCNPAYFTIGNLIKYLQGLEAAGRDRRAILEDYVFLTAGACGPCRFGMYEAEYRLALRNAGFEGFRVLLFQQSAGLDQSREDAGLDMNLDFFLALLNTMNVGDMVNEFAYQLRPYEVEAGAVDAALEDGLGYLADVLRNRPRGPLESAVTRLRPAARLHGAWNYIVKFADQLAGRHLVRSLKHVQSRFDEIELDRFRIRPIVKITGEFWAQTTEGDGNFRMFRFLEDEGAEVFVDPLGSWILYLLHQYRQSLRDRRGTGHRDGGSFRQSPIQWIADRRRYATTQATMSLAERIFRREYRRHQKALAGSLCELADQYEMQRIASPFFNSRAEGGEGHLEVAKNIYYHEHGLCHMVISLKPFGCTPSTQSDGVQAAVVERFKDMIYLPIETSGEGEVNALSRVQMGLGNARTRARQEFQKALSLTGRRLEEIRAFVDDHPRVKKPSYQIPCHGGFVGRAANFVLHAASLMERI